MACHGIERQGMTWKGNTKHDMERKGMEWHGIEREKHFIGWKENL
jgi:hypothetical protein